MCTFQDHTSETRLYSRVKSFCLIGSKFIEFNNAAHIVSAVVVQNLIVTYGGHLCLMISMIVEPVYLQLAL